MDSQIEKNGKLPLEEALEKTGYGIYNYLIIALAGIGTIAFVALTFGSTIIVPASACELATTSAQQGLLIAVPVLGAVIGTLLWGYLGDTRGRRRMLLLSLTLGGTSNALASISVNWLMLMIVQLFTVTFGSGIYVLSMTLLSESVPVRKRNVAMLLVSSIFLLGQGLISVMAIPVIPLSFSYYMPALGIYWNSWRTMQVVFSLPCVLCGICLLFMQESPKYALASGDEEWSMRILETFYRVNNGKRAEEFGVKGLLKETGTAEKKSAKDQILPLFKMPYLKYTLVMASLFILHQIVIAFLVWAPTITNKFMKLLETGEGTDFTLCQIIDAEVEPDPNDVPCSLNRNALLLMFGVCAMHSFFNTILSQIVDKTGRRNMAMVVASICGVAGILINLIPNAVGTVVLFMVFSIALVSMGFYTTISVALFPTHLRTTAVALTMIGARLMSVFFIQIVNYLLTNWCAGGFYVCSALFGSSVLLLALIPDDRRLRAPPPKDSETTEEKRSSS
ncbi:solute carrier family 22 member 13-like [Cydia strobilella]|uniref:solute carrier family 22 member 13-like n=1 Tax=Cydia strobilella TaxID=1100964 RepID=UPI0030063F2F